MYSPIVFVSGLYGNGRQRYWGRYALNKDNVLQLPNYHEHQIIVTQVGSVSSLHDRACELFYELYGGQLDYGKQHCEQYQHKQYGKTYEASYPDWGADNPIHLVGHSFGGDTSLYLQQLLANDYFGKGTTADWIKSITTIASPLRGGSTSYIMGIRDNGVVGGRRLIEKHPSSIFGYIAMGGLTFLPVLVLEYLALPFYIRSDASFNMGQWSLSWSAKGIVKSMVTFMKGLIGDVEFMNNGDNGPQTLSARTRAELINQNQLSTHSNTVYQSYILSNTHKDENDNYVSTTSAPLPFTYVSNAIGSYIHPHPHTEEAWHDLDWRETDNVCNVNSQYHPYVCEHMTKSMQIKAGHNAKMNKCIHCHHYEITFDPVNVMKSPAAQYVASSVNNAATDKTNPTQSKLSAGTWTCWKIDEPVFHSLMLIPPSKVWLRNFFTHLHQQIEAIDSKFVG